MRMLFCETAVSDTLVYMGQSERASIPFNVSIFRFQHRVCAVHFHSLEHAAAGDHVTVVTGGIQACTEDGTVP